MICFGKMEESILCSILSQCYQQKKMPRVVLGLLVLQNVSVLLHKVLLVR